MMQAHKRNNIGVLRLCFASLVIIGHAPEMVDGNRDRKPLTSLFHTLSLGDLSVDAFFLLSGFLITKSMAKTGRLLPFAERRVLRIYPAFTLAYLLSVFVLGPLVGAAVWGDPGKTAVKLLMLREPADYAGQFPGLHTYPILNGSLWTISHEFQCYLLVGLLGVLGILRHRWLVLGVTVLLLGCAVAATFPALSAPLAHLDDSAVVRFLFGRTTDIVRLVPIFMVGACWYLFEAEMETSVTGIGALICAFICCAALYRDHHFAELGLTVFGGASLYWLAFKAVLGPLQRVNDRWDISYGTYLYGWPVAIYMVWRDPAISPWMVAVMALPLALTAGAASWWGVERWTKDLVWSRSDPLAARDEPTALLQRTDQRRARALLNRAS